MRIERVGLHNFRNYSHLELSFEEGTNLFYGDNAQGKTNILESMYLCGTTKSHRGGKDREFISFGEDESHIQMDVCRKNDSYRLDMHLKKNKAKGIAINRQPVKRASELIGICSFVFFSPEDLGIIKNGPGERRRFMDMELCQLSRLYLSSLSDYNKVLMQRNKLLKDMAFRKDYLSTLDIWDAKLCEYAVKLITEREKFVAFLHEKTVPIHRKLTGEKEEMEIIYERDVSADQMEEKIRAGRERDIQMRMTCVGPHRDDLLIRANGIDLRRYGSQGQQRTAALSLKLAEIELVQDITGDIPVLFLDDVLSELDQSRQQFLLDHIRDVQTMMTCTGIEDFKKRHFKIDKLFFVKNAAVIEKR